MSPKTPTEETPIDPAAGWEAAGRQIAPMLGSYSAAIITSSDELAAAHVAIGIGLAEAEHRRVAIGDLVGEVDPIQSLVSSDDPHGISDSFTYGVSLNKIAQPIDTTGNLFIMPSGTGSVADPEIYRNMRWQRLANGFREVGALLLLVAPADAPALQELIDQMDGVVLVGTTPLDFAPYLNVLARVPAPIDPNEQRRRRSGPSKRRTTTSKIVANTTAVPPKKPLPIWKIAGLLILLIALASVGVYMNWVNSHTTATVHRRRPVAAQPQTPPPAPAPPKPETLSVAPIANPADSSNAAAYAVELESFSDSADATLMLRRNRSYLHAGTISPVPVGTARELYYKVVSGAFPNRREADVLLDVLKHNGVIISVPGTVVRTPYALLLDSAAAGTTETQALRPYAHLPLPAYVLAQPDHSLKVYAGAFERPDDSATLMATLRAAKLNPTLVYRTGRSP